MGDHDGSRGPDGYFLCRAAENGAVPGTYGLFNAVVTSDCHGGTRWLRNHADFHAEGGFHSHGDVDVRGSFQNDDSQHQRELVFIAGS